MGTLKKWSNPVRATRKSISSAIQYGERTGKSMYGRSQDMAEGVFDPAREGLKEVTGANDLEEANELARQQYDEQKAAAAAEEKAATEAAYASIEKDRRRRAAMRGRSSTILTGSLGDTGLSVSKKTLLGG